MDTDTENAKNAVDSGLPKTGGASVPASRERGEVAPTAPLKKKVKRSWIPNTKQSPMRRLKQLWCTRFTDEEKEFWHEKLGTGSMPVGVAREVLQQRHGIFLRTTLQVGRFQDWIKEDKSLEQKNERMKENERRLQKAFPNATKDEIREKLLRLTYAQIYSEADFGLFIKTAKTDVQIDTLNLNREKFKESLRAKIMAGIEMLAVEASKNPIVKAAVDQLRAALTPE